MVISSENNQAERTQEFDKYRKKFAFLIICRHCARSFDSGRTDAKGVIPSNDKICKFCGSENIVKRGQHLFRYYCTSCEKSYISHDKRDVCRKCGNQFIHMRRITDLSRSDRLEIQKVRIKTSIFGKKTKKENKKATIKNKLNIRKPAIKAKIKKPAIKRRTKEELPTY